MSATDNGVTPQDLLLIVGELVVENRLLRARIQALELEIATMKEALDAHKQD